MSGSAPASASVPGGRWPLVLAALLLLFLPLVRPAVRWVDPGAAVRAAGHGELFWQVRWSWRLTDDLASRADLADPWGRPWAMLQRGMPGGGVTQH